MLDNCYSIIKKLLLYRESLSHIEDIRLKYQTIVNDDINMVCKNMQAQLSH